MKLLAWLWPIPRTFDACPISSWLWLAALERDELLDDDLERVLELVGLTEPTSTA